MSTDDLTPAGSATYNSGSMFVGDGTWDTSSNTFLLPNLQGLNYATTRYNGMGARFANFPGYTNIIVAHGILAAITFLFLVPLAIMINRFYWRSPYWKLRIHIWAQILTVLLTTVVFILGFFAVGLKRSLTNPHHGIGVALYVLILVQFLGGYLNYKHGRRRKYVFRPLRIVLHQWLGRLIGLLGIIQVALGLTLYGSPLSLFVLYAIAVFTLLVTYFVLDFMRSRDVEGRADGRSSYVSGTDYEQTEKPGRRFGLGQSLLAGGALGALAGKLRGKRRHSQSEYSEDYSEYQSQAQSGRPSHRPSHRPGASQLSEKHSEHVDDPPEKHTWRNRLLGLGALGGLGYWLSRRGKKDDRESEFSSNYYNSDYTSQISGGTMSRVEAAEEGRPHTPVTPNRPTTATAQTPNSQDRLTRPSHAGTHSSVSYDDDSSYLSGSPSKYRPRHGIRDGLLGLGFLGAAKGMFDFKKRRERKEQKRIEELRRQEAEDEVVQRRRSKKFTGDGRRPGPQASFVSAAQSSADPRSGLGSVMPSVAPSAIPSAAPGASTTGPFPMPGPPGAPGPIPGPPPGSSQNMMSGALPQSTTSLPPPPPIHDASGTYSPSGSRPSTAFPLRSDGQPSVADTTAAALAGAAGGAALGGVAGHHSRDTSRNRRDSSQARRPEQSPATPVSVKLNMHPDGRHVTLRRLTEEEAAKERESKRTRNRSRRNKAGSGNGSALSEVDSERWRRTEQTDSPSRLARLPYAGTSAAGSTAAIPQPPPPPPAVTQSPAPPSHAPATPYAQSQGIMSNQSLMPPGSVSTIQGQRRPSQSPAGILSNQGSAMSPPNVPESQGSQMSNYEENRRRRRAERARQKAGQRVEFE